MATIKIDHYDNSYEIKFDEGITMDELANHFANLSLMMGYGRASVDKYIINFDSEGIMTILDEVEE